MEELRDQNFEKWKSAQYNYVSTNGWVVVLKNNNPVNFYADCGYSDDSYHVVDEIFKAMCEELKGKADIVDIIVEYNKMRSSFFKNYDLDITQ